MRLTGPGITGPPADVDNARAVLRRAVELGVNHIDTADAYGPDVSEELIAEALHPYPDDLVIATKGGLVRTARAASGRRTAGRSTCARRARGACGGCASTPSTSTTCIAPTPRSPTRSPSAR